MRKKPGIVKRVMGTMVSPMVRVMMTKPVHNMLRMLDETDEREYTCDQAFEVLDLYAEMTMRGEDPSVLLPLVKKHLEMCGNCREEFETLLSAMQTV